MRSLSIFVILLISLFCVSALDIAESATSSIIVHDLNIPAKTTLSITGVPDDEYTLYTLTDVKLLPAEPFRINSTSNNVVVSVYPTKQLTTRGTYTFTYNIRNSGKDINAEKRMTVKILDLKDLIEVGSDSNSPESGKISFYLQNKENVKLENLKVKFSSIFFNLERTITLNPNDRTTITIELDKEKIKAITAGTYILKAEVEKINGVENFEGKIYWGEKKEIETQEYSSGLIIVTKTITKTNLGNVDDSATVQVTKNIITRLFTTLDTTPDKIERKGFFVDYTWTRKLGPTEGFAIQVRTNYIAPLLFVLVLAVLYLAFKRYNQTKIEVIKSASHVKTKNDIFALRIQIKMRAKRDVQNVSLIDKIPGLVKVYEKFGAIKPSKIDIANRRIQWNVGNLAAGEERTYSYIVYSKIGIVGKVALPEALAVYEKGGEVHEISSNRVFFLSEQTRRDED